MLSASAHKKYLAQKVAGFGSLGPILMSISMHSIALVLLYNMSLEPNFTIKQYGYGRLRVIGHEGMDSTVNQEIFVVGMFSYLMLCTKSN